MKHDDSAVHWEKLNSIFLSASLPETISVFESLREAGADLDKLSRSAKMLRDLHCSNTGDPDGKISTGYGVLSVYCYIHLNLMGPALGALEALESMKVDREVLSFLESAISKKFSRDNTGPAELIEEPEDGQISLDDLERDFQEFFQDEPPKPFNLNTPLFSRLSPEQSLEIMRTVELRRFEAGDTVFEEGDAAQCMYIISDGEFELQTSSNQNKLFQAGDFFGEIALVAKLKRTGRVKAKTAGSIVEIPKDKMIELFIRFPEIEEEVLKLYYLRLFKNLASRMDVFKSASDQELEEFFYSFRAESRNKGEEIFPENSSSQSLYFLLSGQVQLSKGKQLIDSVQMGQFFGEGASINSEPRSASAIAKSKVDLLVCESFMLDSLYRSFPKLEAFLQKLSKHRNTRSTASA